MAVKYTYRPMTNKEYKRMQKAFDEHALEFDIPPEKQERHGFIAIDGKKFVGCSSGLAQKYNNTYSKYFYLSDLLVEKQYRRLGYGKQLLLLLEEKIKSLGIEYIWTWTAEYEASAFYLKQGYTVFTKFKQYYPSGHERVGLIKKL